MTANQQQRTETTDNDYGPPQQRLTDIAYRLSLMLIALPLFFCDL